MRFVVAAVPLRARRLGGRLDGRRRSCARVGRAPSPTRVARGPSPLAALGGAALRARPLAALPHRAAQRDDRGRRRRPGDLQHHLLRRPEHGDHAAGRRRRRGLSRAVRALRSASSAPCAWRSTRSRRCRASSTASSASSSSSCEMKAGLLALRGRVRPGAAQPAAGGRDRRGEHARGAARARRGQPRPRRDPGADGAPGDASPMRGRASSARSCSRSAGCSPRARRSS